MKLIEIVRSGRKDYPYDLLTPLEKFPLSQAEFDSLDMDIYVLKREEQETENECPYP